jgi:hypothetical protein
VIFLATEFIPFQQKNNRIDMPIKYLIREIIMNERFARTQKISWDRQKEILFSIITELKQNNLFKAEDKDNPNYNLVEYGESDPSYALGIVPLERDNFNALFDWKLLDNEQITSTPVSDSNYRGKGFACLFRLGIIKHDDIILFEEGNEEKLWTALDRGDNAGELSKTAIGIIASEKLHKIFAIKQSTKATSGYSELLYYLHKKSITFSNFAAENISFKMIPFFSEESFDQNNVGSLKSLEIGINSDLIDDYKIRIGGQDAFYSLLISKLPKIFGTGRTAKFELSFSEEGDESAKELFNDLYGSFVSVQDEEIEKMFTTFKILYENISGQEVKVNFKRDKIYSYIPHTEDTDLVSIQKALGWISEIIQRPTSELSDELSDNDE